MNRILSLFVLLSVFQLAIAQQNQGVLDYIERYKAVAIQEMVRCGIPASITLAQGIHESNYGKSPLSREANNHFGIKCKNEWDGKKYYLDDDAPDECFRVYEHAEASYADHSDFLVTRSRYADLFQLRITDYQGWANGLKAAGYATNPKYAHILIKQIEDYNLQQFDQAGLALIREKGRPVSYPAPVVAESKPTPVVSPKVPDAPKVEAESPGVTFMGSVEHLAPVKVDENKRKEYSVNGLRALMASANEDPLKIAMDYELELSQVMQFNDLTTGERFKSGEYIFLQQKKSRSSESTYQVNNKESMRDVAQKFGIRLRDLYSRNLMKLNDQPSAGETLSLRDKRNDPPKTITYAQFLKSLHPKLAATPKKINDPAAYQVQPSDTLFSIARKFNMSVDELKALNNLDSVTIREGQHLVVSK